MSIQQLPAQDPVREQDAQYMSMALEQAGAIPVRPWPNPPVGAVVVRDGNVLGLGAHHGPGTPHAERVALDKAGAGARGATLYVTLEPCNHDGRTPPCAPAIAEAGIRRVVFAMRDPNPTVAGGGGRFLRERGLDVVCGIKAREALELVWPFVVTDNFQRTFIELKTAQSMDGLFAPDPAHRTAMAPVYLTGTLSRQQVHRRRCWMDAVLVGEGTARADRPRLDSRLARTPADGPRKPPRPGYFDTDLSFGDGLAADSFLAVAGAERAPAARIEALRAAGAQVLLTPEKDGHIDPAAAVSALHEAGVMTAMIEGGPRLARSFLAAGLVDRWSLFVAPVFLGGGVRWPDAPVASHGYTLTRVERYGQDTLSVYDRTSFLDMLLKVMA